MKKTISLILVLALWGSLTAFAWLKPPVADSAAERRPLEQFPALDGKSLLCQHNRVQLSFNIGDFCTL